MAAEDDAQPPSRRRIRWVRLVVPVAIAALALWWTLRGVDLQQAMAELSRVSLLDCIAIAGVMMTQMLVRAARAHVLTSPAVRPPYRTQLSIAFTGLLALNVLPLRLGEVVRPALWHRHGVELSEAGQILVVERAMDLAALLVMLLTVTLFVDLPGPGIVVSGIDVLTVATRTLTVGLILVAVALASVLLLGARVGRFLRRLSLMRLASFAELSQSALRRMLGAPGRVFAAVVLTGLLWGSVVSVAAVVMYGLGIVDDLGFDLLQTMRTSLTASAATLAGTLAVPTPGFFGPFELCARATLQLWGVETTRAATFGIVWHLFIFGFVVVGGVVALLISGASLRQLIAPDEDPDPAPG